MKEPNQTMQVLGVVSLAGAVVSGLLVAVNWNQPMTANTNNLMTIAAGLALVLGLVSYFGLPKGKRNASFAGFMFGGLLLLLIFGANYGNKVFQDYQERQERERAQKRL